MRRRGLLPPHAVGMHGSSILGKAYIAQCNLTCSGYSESTIFLGEVIIQNISLLHLLYKNRAMVEDSSVQLCLLDELSEFDVGVVVQVEGDHDPNHV